MKYKKNAILLALFLGVFGAHRFYLNQKVKGFIYLILSWTLISFFLSIIDSIIFIFMSNENFNKRYNSNSNNLKSEKKNKKEFIVENNKEEKKISSNNIDSNHTITLNFDAKPIEDLLINIGNIKSINEINLWDNKALIQMEKIKMFKEKLDSSYQSIMIKINSSQTGSYFQKINKKNKILNENKGFLSQYNEVKHKLDLYYNYLEYWLNLSPNSLIELNEMKVELKEKKQLLSLKKRELNIVKRDMWNLYRADSAYVEFSSPKLRHFNRGINIKNREENLSPYHKAIKEVDLQLIEIDKVILWLNKIH